MTNREKAREYFGLGVGDDDFVLHHVDSTLKTRDPKRYNEWRIEDLVVMTRDEHSRLHNKGKKLSEKTRNKLSVVNKGKKRTKEQRNKLSAVNKGKKHSEETKKKMSEAHTGKTLSEEHKQKLINANKRPVAQYNLDGQLIKIWDSAMQAEKEGFNQGNIAKVCRGKRKHHKGYVWKYANK